MSSGLPFPAGQRTATCSPTHWNMSRSPVKSSAVPPASRSRVGERAEEVVGLEVPRVEDPPAERAEEVPGLRPLVRERVGHGRAVGVVAREVVRAVGRGLRAEAEDDRARGVRLDGLQDEVRAAEQRVDGLPLRVLDRVREREERAVEQRRRVDGEQRGGHPGCPTTPGLGPAPCGNPRGMPSEPRMIQVFQAEWCPFSALVRERLNELDLPFVALPVPVDREARDVMDQRTGTRAIPAVILEDGTVLAGDAADIVSELSQRFPEPPTAQAHRDALAAHPLGQVLPG